MNDAARSHVRNALAPFAVVEDVSPEVDGGRFAIKRCVGEEGRVGWMRHSLPV